TLHTSLHLMPQSDTDNLHLHSFPTRRSSDLTLEQLHLPEHLAEFTEHTRGLILVTGPTGSGKSTTLASLINIINEKRKEHILTRSEEHTSELQSRFDLVCRLLLEKKKNNYNV